ncbi:MAG TPA: AMP-binding protein [Xanthobacteraceae bacterium]|nr:AMP-binding protein [Xanthobacteraceae bacterium]
MDERLADLSVLAKRPADAWRRAGWWGRKPLWERVREVAERTPGKLAVREYGRELSYGELWRMACRYSAAMTLSGVGRRDIILVQLPNWIEFVALAVGAELTGAVFSFCPVQWDQRETLRALRIIKPKAWFTTSAPRERDDRTAMLRGVLDTLGARAPLTVLMRGAVVSGALTETDWAGPDEGKPLPAIEGARGQEPLEIAVTSGSTGDPKGVLHVHDSAIATVDSTIERQGIGPDDLIHVALPVGHTFGYFYGVRCALQAGAALQLQHGWTVEEAVDLIGAGKATVSLGPSAFIIDMMGLPQEKIEKLASLWLFTLSGDSLPGPIVRKAAQTLPFRISRALGMTEFGHALSTDATMSVEEIADTLGTPQPGMTFRITDEAGRVLPAGQEGQIGVSGPFLFTGYLGEQGLNQDVLDKDGFFPTGDLGIIDERGFLRISGRLKNVIRRGAETIPVALLEDVIASHPDVLHAVVVGVPDQRLGELPIACVQLKPGRSLELADLEALFQRQHITKKFWPSGLRLVETWPIGATGKIDRKLLTQQIG